MSHEEAVAEIARLKDRITAVEAEIRVHISAARAAGVSWQVIADALGTSRQAAWEKYRPSK